MKKVNVLSTSDGYEAIYINQKLYDFGNDLGEGDNALYFLKLHEKFPDIKSSDIAFSELSAIDECEMEGHWPDDMCDFNNSYEQV